MLQAKTLALSFIWYFQLLAQGWSLIFENRAIKCPKFGRRER